MTVTATINKQNGKKTFRYGQLLIEQGFSNSNPSRVFYTVKFRSFRNDSLYIPVGEIYAYPNVMSTPIKAVNDYRFYGQNKSLDFSTVTTDISELILSLNSHLISIMK